MIKYAANHKTARDLIPNQFSGILRTLGKSFGVNIKQHTALALPPVQYLYAGESRPDVLNYARGRRGQDILPRLENLLLELKGGAHEIIGSLPL